MGKKVPTLEPRFKRMNSQTKEYCIKLNRIKWKVAANHDPLTKEERTSIWYALGSLIELHVNGFIHQCRALSGKKCQCGAVYFSKRRRSE